MKEGSLAAMSTRSRVFSKTTMFFSEYGHRPDVAGAVFGHRKRSSSGWKFLKTEMYRICAHGPAKTEFPKRSLFTRYSMCNIPTPSTRSRVFSKTKNTASVHT